MIISVPNGCDIYSHLPIRTLIGLTLVIDVTRDLSEFSLL